MRPAPSDRDHVLSWTVADQDADKRVDVLLADMLDDLSRAQVRRIIEAGGVWVAGKPCKPATRVSAGQTVSIRPGAVEPEIPEPEPIPLEVLYEDQDVAVINKPPGMVVHPGRGRWNGTLVAALAYHFQQLSSVGGPARPGIVHRLDRDTSGVMVVARNNRAHERIADQFKARTVDKAYLAIVGGSPDRDRDWIECPIGRHPYQREKMAIRSGHETSREARTFYEVIERFPGYSLIRAEPKTGRTHQIRLHLLSIGCPVLCDRLYGGRSEITAGELLAARKEFTRAAAEDAPPADPDTPLLMRQALHAAALSFEQPTTGRRLSFTAPLPADMQTVLDLLRA